eukprot:2455280-Alexandrium_andersonii.AAC.1
MLEGALSTTHPALVTHVSELGQDMGAPHTASLDTQQNTPVCLIQSMSKARRGRDVDTSDPSKAEP